MVFRKIVLAIAIFAIVAVGAFTMYQVSDLGQNDAQTTEKTQTNQSVVVEYDAYQYVNLNDSTAGFTDNITAYNQSGSTLIEDIDYKWNSTDGTILYINTANTTEGNTSNVTYDYYQNTQPILELAGPINGITEAVGNSTIMAAGIAFVLIFLAIGGFMAKKFTTSGPRSNR